MPTRCNRGFYCRSYFLLNMFRAALCPSSGAQEYYTVVAACGVSCCGFQVAGLVWSWGLCVWFAGCSSISILQTGHTILSSTPDQQLENHSTKHHRQQNSYYNLYLIINLTCNNRHALYFRPVTLVMKQGHVAWHTWLVYGKCSIQMLTRTLLLWVYNCFLTYPFYVHHFTSVLNIEAV